MTIKHLGGVFGRNPTFNDVTIEGQLTFEGNIDVDSDITWDDNKKALFGDNADLAIYSDGTQSFITESGPGRLYIGGTHLSITNASGTKNYFQGIDGGAATLYNSGSAKLSTSSTGISVTGNIAVDSGNGIDFSATSGTGTSELFDDYEEGTWSPVYIPQIGSFTTMTMDISNAKYTKVGRFVYVQASILTDNVDITGGSGGLRLSGLPFSSSGFGSFVISYAQAWGGDVPLYGYIENGSTYANLRYRSSVNGADSAMLVNDLSTGAVANQNYMIISGVYTAS